MSVVDLITGCCCAPSSISIIWKCMWFPMLWCWCCPFVKRPSNTWVFFFLSHHWIHCFAWSRIGVLVSLFLLNETFVTTFFFFCRLAFLVRRIISEKSTTQTGERTNQPFTTKQLARLFDWKKWLWFLFQRCMHRFLWLSVVLCIVFFLLLLILGKSSVGCRNEETARKMHNKRTFNGNTQKPLDQISRERDRKKAIHTIKLKAVFFPSI